MLSTEHMCGGSLIIVSFLYLGDVGHDGPEREDVVVEPAAPPPLGLQVLGLEPRCRRRLPLTPVPAAEVEHRRDEVLRLHLLAAARPLPPRHCGRTTHHSRQAGGGAGRKITAGLSVFAAIPAHPTRPCAVAGGLLYGWMPAAEEYQRQAIDAEFENRNSPLFPGGSWLLLLATLPVPWPWSVAWTPPTST
jgi:hypothetical protein